MAKKKRSFTVLILLFALFIILFAFLIVHRVNQSKLLIMGNRTHSFSSDASPLCKDPDGYNPFKKGIGVAFGKVFGEKCIDNQTLTELWCKQTPLAVLPIIQNITCKFGCDMANGACFGEGEKEKATCDDGIQNQGEEGIDCGGPCLLCLVKKNCSETDGGDNPYTPGSVITDIGGGDVYVQNDTCNNSTQLKERYCTAYGPKVNFHICDCLTTPDGIGYCVKEEDILCTDTDGNAGTKTVGSWPYETTLDLRLLTAGEATKSTKSGTALDAKTDSCDVEGGTTVIEASCSGKEVASSSKKCPVIDVPDLFGDDIAFVCENGACCQKEYPKGMCIENDAGVDTVKAATTSLIGSCGTEIGEAKEKTDSCVVVSCKSGGEDTIIANASTYNCPAGTNPAIKEFDGQYGDAVKEYSCDGIGGPIKEQVVACKKGEMCAGGECVSISCFDSDIPVHVTDPDPAFVQGTAAGIVTDEIAPEAFLNPASISPYAAYQIRDDYCMDENTLVEFQCGLPEDVEYIGGASVYVTYVGFVCENGCENGKCKEGGIKIKPDIKVNN